MVQISTPWGDP